MATALTGKLTDSPHTRDAVLDSIAIAERVVGV